MFRCNKIHEQSPHKMRKVKPDRCVDAEMVTDCSLTEKYWHVKRIGALSAPWGCNCPGQPHPRSSSKYPVPISLCAPICKLMSQPSLLAWAMLQVCLSTDLSPGQPSDLCHSLSLDLFSRWTLDTYGGSLSNPVSGPISCCSCLDSLGWILDSLHCLKLSGTLDRPSYQCWALPMLSRCWELC